MTFIIDASSLQYRAFHASKERPTYTKDGTPNYGVNLLRIMLESLRKEHKPDCMVAACDCNALTFRHVLYPAYKVHRQQQPVEYKAQLQGFRDVLCEFRIPVYEVPGFEADDIIGTLARRISGGSEVVIVSGDKDMAQLVNDRVHFLNTGLNRILNVRGVLDEYGVWPNQIADYLALVGDTSDNVPGCKGIGHNGAVTLLRTFGTVEEIITHAAEIQLTRYRHAVLQCSMDIMLSKKLATINCDVPL